MPAVVTIIFAARKTSPTKLIRRALNPRIFIVVISLKSVAYAGGLVCASDAIKQYSIRIPVLFVLNTDIYIHIMYLNIYSYVYIYIIYRRRSRVGVHCVCVCVCSRNSGFSLIFLLLLSLPLLRCVHFLPHPPPQTSRFPVSDTAARCTLYTLARRLRFNNNKLNTSYPETAISINCLQSSGRIKKNTTVEPFLSPLLLCF